MTGAGVVVSEHDAEQVEALEIELKAELRPNTASTRTLVERMAVLAVRMERSAAQEEAAIAGRIRQALDDFEAPEGLDEASVARLRREAADLALFDPSKEATLARKYDADAQRGFFRALRELRQIQKEEKADLAAPRAAEAKAALGSFLQAQKLVNLAEKLPAPRPTPAPSKASRDARLDDFMAQPSRLDVPIAIGRRG